MSSYNEPTPVLSTSTSSNAAQIRPPGENDVIVGIGCNKHCGNVKFSQFIKAYKRARFRTNPSIETKEAVKEVVQFWRKLSPRGRFLAQKSRNSCGEWHEVEDKQAMRIAAFFLLNQNGGDKKRQPKSSDAIRDNRASASAQSSSCDNNSMNQFSQPGQSQGQGQAQFQQQRQQQQQPSQGFQFQGSFQGQGQMHFQGQLGGQMPQQMSQQSQKQNFQAESKQFPQQDDWAASLEPVPIGPIGQTSMGWNGMDKSTPQVQGSMGNNTPQVQGSMGNLQNYSDPVKPQVQGSMGNMQNFQQDFVKPQVQGSMQNFQREPVKQQRQPSMGFGTDDFDFNPLPLEFSNDDDFDPLPLPANNQNQFCNAPPAAEQVQVSVNMVVNTMPQGYSRDNNGAVNTVTNIQIGTGTINDDRNMNKQAVMNDNSYPTNGNFIQISTQSNPSSSTNNLSNCMPGNRNSGMSSLSNGNRPQQMNDFQIGFFGGTDDYESDLSGGQQEVVSNPSQNSIGGFVGNNRMSLQQQQQNGMSLQQQQQNGYSAYMMGNNTSNAMNGQMANGNNVQMANGNNGQDNDGDDRWNKNKVASAVPCAASLADIFDDW